MSEVNAASRAESLISSTSSWQRLSFLNRGQGWVVRKLKQTMQRVRDRALYGDLAHMLSSHVENITLTNSAIA